ncbi:MAG: transglutaminase TgpA family protein [Acidimicrobiales bacterium]
MRSSQAAARPPLGVVPNAAVAGLTLAAVLGLARLFTDPARFVVPVVLIAAVVHMLCWACRRYGIGLALSALLAVVATTLCASWAIFGSTTVYGIPGRDTAHAARLALSTASQVYRSVAPPAPVVPGFTLAAAVGAATAAFLADWAAFRMRATIEACLPSFSLFVLSAALAQGQGEVLAAAVWLAALLAFLLVRHGAVESAPTAWFASRGRRNGATVARTGVALGACAVAVAVAVGPHLPGATVRPLINWRHHNSGDSSRTIGVSPLVDITARLQSQSHQEVFTVGATRPEYWRLTSLDHFENNGWSLRNEFVPTSGRLPSPAGTSPAATPLRAEFRISALSSIWLPAAYRPTNISGIGGVSFSVDSGSLITNHATSDGLTYSVSSAVPAATPAALAAAAPTLPGDPALDRYLQLPALPAQVARIAADVTRAATTPYGKARALQDWLRGPTFRYDLNVAPDDSPNALLNFLTVTRAGFCQQFAAAYAVLARAAGLPTRVAVGFTEGQAGADGLYHVTDAHAHAWPEVYFRGVGWIAFEPTPGRGSADPSARSVTGVPPAQDTSAVATNGATPPATAPRTSGPSPTTPARGASSGTASGRAAPHHRPFWRSGVAVVLFALAAIGLAWVALLAAATAVVHRRRLARARTPGDVVALAWTEATEALTDAGVAPRVAETPAEFARRAGDALPRTEAAVLGDLAGAVEVTDYAPSGATREAVDVTVGAAARIRAALRADRPWREWARARIDPRPPARLVASELSRRRA